MGSRGAISVIMDKESLTNMMNRALKLDGFTVTNVLVPLGRKNMYRDNGAFTITFSLTSNNGCKPEEFNAPIVVLEKFLSKEMGAKVTLDNQPFSRRRLGNFEPLS